MNFKNTRYSFIACLLLLMLSCKVSKTEKKASEDYVDKVYPLLDTENSRWFYFSSASRPFGMINLSPDTQIDGAWGSGYRYNTDTIKGFSHVHAWQMAGLSIMPVTAETDDDQIFTDFYSKFDHQTEEIHPGYHKLFLDRYQIETELTSTTRVGFHKYNYQNNNSQALLFNLNTALGPCDNAEGSLVLDSEKVVSGLFKMTPTSRRPKALITYFEVHFNKPVASIKKDNNTGNYLVTFEEDAGELMAKVGISYTSPENANLNIQSELDHWDFDKVVKESRDHWNKLLGRIRVEGGDKKQQDRFYTDLWHALQGRRIISDYNGDYPDNTGDKFRIGKLPLGEDGMPLFNHYNSDSFWGAQWTINTLWGLVYPEVMKEFTMSLMQYYKDGGYIPRGPSGGNYTHVMTGASSTPFIVSAIQKGLISEDLDEIYQALKLNHMPGGIMAKAGYEHETSIGGGLDYYLDKGYVPYPLPVPEDEYGIHKDGSSMTLEYAYQDYTLAQLAKKLGKLEDYNYFTERSKKYKNVFNHNVGWMSPRKADGSYSDDFDPYQYENGFVEANAAQATWFVPHDLEGLSLLMGGKKEAILKLNNQFVEAEKLGFTSGTSHDAELHPEYSRIPINYGNQPSIETAFIFTKLGNPELTQYWSRKIVNTVFSDVSPSRGYNGDEDQGLMGSLSVLMKIGLFQMNGGTEEDPAYQIGSPIFDKITIDLNSDFYDGKELSIISNNNSKENVYVEQAEFNDKKLDSFEIKHSDLIKGGELKLLMTGSENEKQFSNNSKASN